MLLAFPRSRSLRQALNTYWLSGAVFAAEQSFPAEHRQHREAAVSNENHLETCFPQLTYPEIRRRSRDDSDILSKFTHRGLLHPLNTDGSDPDSELSRSRTLRPSAPVHPPTDAGEATEMAEQDAFEVKTTMAWWMECGSSVV